MLLVAIILECLCYSTLDTHVTFFPIIAIIGSQIMYLEVEFCQDYYIGMSYNWKTLDAYELVLSRSCIAHTHVGIVQLSHN